MKIETKDFQVARDDKVNLRQWATGDVRHKELLSIGQQLKKETPDEN